MKTQVNIKLDADVKKKAQAQAKKLGLSLSAVINATLSQFARDGGLEISTRSIDPDRNMAIKKSYGIKLQNIQNKKKTSRKTTSLKGIKRQYVS